MRFSNNIRIGLPFDVRFRTNIRLFKAIDAQIRRNNRNLEMSDYSNNTSNKLFKKIERILSTTTSVSIEHDSCANWCGSESGKQYAAGGGGYD